MPELPEVECVRRGLARSKLSSKVITEVWRSAFALRTGAFWRDERLHLLEGVRTGAFERRGKFLLWRLEADDGPRTAVVHLGMTGRLTVRPENSERELHTHLVLTLEGGRALHYVDPRRFGGVHVDHDAALVRTGPVAELGPEPLAPGFDGAVLAERAGRSRRVLRDVLLDQRVVAGLGNIYVSEAMHAAGLPPMAPAAELESSAWTRLAVAIRDVLNQGLRNGGTTLRDYRGTRGERGRNQEALRVYGRAGLPCPGCGQPLRAHAHAGRTGVDCSRCQPVGRRR